MTNSIQENYDHLPRHRRPRSRDHKPYTVYWLGGNRQIIWGASIENAFTLAGYGGGAVNAVDFYKEGLDCSYYRDADTKQWVPKTSFEFDARDDADRIKKWLGANLKSGVISGARYVRENKDIVTIGLTYGDFAGGAIMFLFVGTAEYMHGSYSEEDDADHHYMSNGTLYFQPTDFDNAVQAFLQVIDAGVPITALKREHSHIEGSKSVQDLQGEQSGTLP